MQTVYLDVLFFFNFGIDYLILSLTLRVAHLFQKEWKVLLGATVGALGACLLFFLSQPFSIGLTVVTFVLSGFLSFGRQKGKNYLKLFCLLFCIAIAFGGGIFALCNVFGITKNGVGYLELPIGLFIFLFLVLYLPIRWAYAIFNRKKATEKRVVEAEITVQGKQFSVLLLSDTGNTLKEPITGKYVLLCDGKDLCTAIEQKKKQGVVAVPFISADNPKGMLVGVFAEKVTVFGKSIGKTVLAPVAHSLSGDGAFNAVISAEALLRI